jgi:hypothetical protein
MFYVAFAFVKFKFKCYAIFICGIQKQIDLQKKTFFKKNLENINRGGHVKETATVKMLTEAVTATKPPWLLQINRAGHVKVTTMVNTY